MLKMEEWLLILDLYSQGFWIGEISKQTGFDRKTVRKYLQLKTLPEPQKRPGRKSKLDLFKPYILEKLKEGPYTAARLYREIKEMGFDGGKTIVKDFVQKVRPEQGISAVLRYETKPGVQSQVDWAEMGTVEVDGKVKKLFCFNISHSWIFKNEICRIYTEHRHSNSYQVSSECV
jgi:transposase